MIAREGVKHKFVYSDTNPFPKDAYPNCWEGHEYAKSILKGEIVSNIYVWGACARYFKDLQTFKGPDSPYYFDPKVAEKYLKYVQNFNHVIGVWANPHILYEPWQKFIFMNIMGWINRETGFRRFRIAHVEIARGNGKSAMASQAALYFLGCENSVGNYISCLATKKDQAKIVLESARMMALKCKSYLKRFKVKVLAHKVVQEHTGSEIRALSSDKNGLDGLNDILAILDELHAMDRAIYDVIISGMSKRRDSLTLCITTAGFNTNSIGFDQSIVAKKICTGDWEDETMFGIVYTLDKDDDIFNPSVWIKANPNYGSSVDPTTLASKVEKAKISPNDLPNLKVKHFNLWIDSGFSFHDMPKWEKGKKEMSLEQFKGRECTVGLDMSTRIDLTSYTITFREKDLNTGDFIYHQFSRAFLPRETFENPENGNYELYKKAEEDGELIVTNGAAVNYKELYEQLNSDLKGLKVISIIFDPWNVTQFSQDLEDGGYHTTEFSMNVKNLSGPMKDFDADMRKQLIFHQGGQLLRYCFTNVVVVYDRNGNVFPRKMTNKYKIDMAVSSYISYAGFSVVEDNTSVYESRGIRSL